MQTANATAIKNPVQNFFGRYALPTDKQQAWGTALAAVSYPVHIKELFFKHTDENGQEYEELAYGVTNTGRDTKFFGVVVDRDYNGALHTIATVTDTYDTIPVPEVYKNLMEDLDQEGIAHNPKYIVVSGNGGCQTLSIEMPEFTWVSGDVDAVMHLTLHTSVDGKTKHHVRLTVFDRKTNAPISGVGMIDYNLSARHTKTIRDRHIAFTTVINRLTKAWSDEVIPMLQLMNGCEFDRDMANDILNTVIEQADIPDRHKEKIEEFYAKSHATGKHSLFGVYRTLSSYLTENMDNRQDRQQAFREKIEKTSERIVRGVMAKIAPKPAQTLA